MHDQNFFKKQSSTSSFKNINYLKHSRTLQFLELLASTLERGIKSSFLLQTYRKTLRKTGTSSLKRGSLFFALLQFSAGKIKILIAKIYAALEPYFLQSTTSRICSHILAPFQAAKLPTILQDSLSYRFMKWLFTDDLN